MYYPKVSIIVPVYNVEKYIIDCLKSIEMQTYENYEVILIDDGSTDDSAGIIKDFIKSKEKFTLIEKKNGGVSSARNKGILKASGEWITFIDSDDYIDENYLFNMIIGLSKYPADFCMSGFNKYFEDTQNTRPSLSTTFAHGTFEKVLDSLFFPSPIARLYSAEIIKLKDIHFDERISCGEDRAFNFDYFCHVKQFLILDCCDYTYRIRGGSLTGSTVLPSQKKHLYEHAKKFWDSFADQSVVIDAFERNHHLAHNILDSFLSDVINLVLEHDDYAYRKMISDSVSQSILNKFGHKKAGKKEKLLVALLKNKQLLLTKIIIRLYYNNRMYRFLKSNISRSRK